ncbi:MAG: NnrU family protein [Oxalobacteraceae bacterium]
MTLLIAGLVLFLAAHSTRLVAEGWRSTMLERLGEKPWKGLISVVSIAGFALIVIGYGQLRGTPVPLWEPPLWTRHVSLLLNLLAFILLTAAYVPRNVIKARLGHPMIAGVKIWALAHLLSNGQLADVLLFGSFLVWAVLDFRASRRRDREHEVSYPPANLLGSMGTLAIGTLAWFVFVMWLHVQLIGVSPLGG